MLWRKSLDTRWGHQEKTKKGSLSNRLTYPAIISALLFWWPQAKAWDTDKTDTTRQEQVKYPQLNTPVYTDDGTTISVWWWVHNERWYGELGLTHISEQWDFWYALSWKIWSTIQYINGKIVYVLWDDTKFWMEWAYLVSEESYNLDDFWSWKTDISQYGLGVSAETYLGKWFTAWLQGQYINTGSKDLWENIQTNSWEDLNYFYEKTITTRAQFTGWEAWEINATLGKSFANWVDLRVKAWYNWFQEGEKYDGTRNQWSWISYGVNGSFPISNAHIDLWIKNSELSTDYSIWVNASLSDTVLAYVRAAYSDRHKRATDDSFSIWAWLQVKIPSSWEVELGKLERLRAIAEGRLDPNKKEISSQEQKKGVRVSPSDLRANPDFERIQTGTFDKEITTVVEKKEKNTLDVDFWQTIYELEIRETFSKNLPWVDSQWDTLSYEVVEWVEGIELSWNNLSWSILDAGTYTLILSYTDREETKQINITFEVKEAAVPLTAQSFIYAWGEDPVTIDMTSYTTWATSIRIDSYLNVNNIEVSVNGMNIILTADREYYWDDVINYTAISPNWDEVSWVITLSPPIYNYEY